MGLKRRSLLAPTVILLGATLAACSDSTSPDTTVNAPGSLTVEATSPTTVRVTWSQVSGADTYELDRSENGGAFGNIGTGLTSTFYEDDGLTPGGSYSYQVRAKRGTTTSANSAPQSVTTPAEPPKIARVTGVTLDRTFYTDTTYVLSGYVKVSNGATLTIQPGTKIVGDTLVPGSSLWILRGAKIMADGTADAPIVFTSWRSEGNRAPGDWGGLIIIGNGLINRTASPIYTEGPVGAAEDYSGGTDFNDSSGSLKYVRVEFAGYDVSNGGGQELNSVSSYAVGRGTTYDYVEAMAGLDDSFEAFGGAQDMRHIVSFETGDDHFDWTEGYQGRAQFLIAIQTSVLTPRPGTGTTSSDPRGFEGDGCEIDKAGCTFANTPYSMPVWANFTVVGPGDGVFSTTDGNGAVVRRGGAANFVNGIIARWPGVGMSIRDAESKARMDEDTLWVRNVLLAENGSNFEPAGTNFGSVLSDSASAWNIMTGALSDVFAGSLPTGSTSLTDANLGIELASSATAATGGLADFSGTPLGPRVQNFFGGAMEATAYMGAIDPAGTDWYKGWTQFKRN